MNKSGYLSKKNSNGKTYIYLRRSYRVNGKVEHEYLYSFGTMPKALDTLYWIRDHPEEFPLKLSERNFNLLDLDEWILTLETQVTSTGRCFKL